MVPVWSRELNPENSSYTIYYNNGPTCHVTSCLKFGEGGESAVVVFQPPAAGRIETADWLSSLRGRDEKH